MNSQACEEYAHEACHDGSCACDCHDDFPGDIFNDDPSNDEVVTLNDLEGK